jgi:hypothetical protein
LEVSQIIKFSIAKELVAKVLEVSQIIKFSIAKELVWPVNEIPPGINQYQRPLASLSPLGINQY